MWERKLSGFWLYVQYRYFSTKACGEIYNLTVSLRRLFISENIEYVVKLLILVEQRPNLGQDLAIIKVQLGPKEKNVKYHSSVLMNITCNTAIMRLMIGS